MKDCESTLGRKRDEIAILERDARELRKTIEKEKRDEASIRGMLVQEEATLGESQEEYDAKIAARNAAQWTNARNCSGATPNSTPSSARRRRK